VQREHDDQPGKSLAGPGAHPVDEKQDLLHVSNPRAGNLEPNHFAISTVS
jgi:hypothetical protein